MPESFRWLFTRGKYVEATDVVKKVARINGQPVPDLSTVKEAAEKERQQPSSKHNYSFVDLFRTWESAKTTIGLLIIW